MVLDIASFLTSALQKQWKTNHLDKKSDVCVVESSQVGRRFRTAVEKEFTKTFLNDAEFVAAIACAKASHEPEGLDDAESPEEPEGGAARKNPEAAPGGGGKTSDPSDADDSVALDESVKVRDLTRSMLSVRKGAATAKSKRCVSETEKTEGGDESENADPKKDEQRDEAKNAGKTADRDSEGKVDEAEMAATGDKLKLKVQEAIKTALQIKDANQKVDLEELPNYQEGYDVYFLKIAFKTKKSDSTEGS